MRIHCRRTVSGRAAEPATSDGVLVQRVADVAQRVPESIPGVGQDDGIGSVPEQGVQQATFVLEQGLAWPML